MKSKIEIKELVCQSRHLEDEIRKNLGGLGMSCIQKDLKELVEEALSLVYEKDKYLIVNKNRGV